MISSMCIYRIPYAVMMRPFVETYKTYLHKKMYKIHNNTAKPMTVDWFNALCNQVVLRVYRQAEGCNNGPIIV